MCHIGIHGTAFGSVGILARSSGKISSVATGSPLNFQEFEPRENLTALSNLINQLTNKAGHPPITSENCRCICIASSGLRTQSDHEQVIGVLGLGGWTNIPHVIVSDGEAALYGGNLTGVGTVIVVGSNATIFGRSDVGKSHQVGGWGTIIGDDGGGLDIAYKALRAVTRFQDGTGEACKDLSTLLMRHMNVTKIDDFPNSIRVYLKMRPKIATLAPAVVSAAEQGDRVAQDILASSATYLFNGYKVVLSHIHLQSTAPIFLEGGIIENSTFLRNRLTRMIMDTDRDAMIMPVKYRTVIGSSLFALSAGRGMPPKKVMSKFLEDLDKKFSNYAELLFGPQAFSK